MDNTIKYFKGANWVTLQGSFTPKELRSIAEETEKRMKKFKDSQNGDKK